MSYYVTNMLMRIPPGIRLVMAFGAVGHFLPKATDRVLPTELDGFPAEVARRAIRMAYENRVEQSNEMQQRMFRVVLPDNFRAAFVVTGIYLAVNKFTVEIRDLPLVGYGLCFCAITLHILREASYVFGGPLLRSTGITAPLAKYLKKIYPSDVRERLEEEERVREITLQLQQAAVDKEE